MLRADKKFPATAVVGRPRRKKSCTGDVDASSVRHHHYYFNGKLYRIFFLAVAKKHPPEIWSKSDDFL